jgi:hypothetical protein
VKTPYNASNAIYSHIDYGPIFGGGCDMCILSGCNGNS